MGKMPAGQRQDGFNPDAAPKWHVREVDAETLTEQCGKFRAEIFAKAGKSDPANHQCNGCQGLSQLAHWELPCPSAAVGCIGTTINPGPDNVIPKHP